MSVADCLVNLISAGVVARGILIDETGLQQAADGTMILREPDEVSVSPVVGAHVADVSEKEVVIADHSDNKRGAHARALRILVRMLEDGTVGLRDGMVEQLHWVMLLFIIFNG